MFVCALTAAPVALAKNWEQPAFPNWSPDFIDDLLTDSPWARSSTVKFMWQPAPNQVVTQSFQIGEMPLPGRLPRTSTGGGGGWPGGGGPASGGGYPRPEDTRLPPPQPTRTEMYLTVRFASALPVRQALAISEFGRNALDSPRAVEILQAKPKEYVIEVAGVPTTSISQGPKWLADELKKSSRLFLKGQRPLSPTSVEIPEQGMHLIATLKYPKFDDIGPDDGTIQFLGAAGTIRIEQQFKLKLMTYHGRLEL